MKNLKERMFEHGVVNFGITLIHAKHRWAKENGYWKFYKGKYSTFGGLSKEGKRIWKNELSAKEKLKYLNETEITKTDKKRKELEINDGKLTCYRTTNESIDDIIQRIEELETEIEERPLSFNTQLGIGIYFFCNLEDVEMCRWLQQKGSADKLITAQIDTDKIAISIDKYKYAEQFDKWLENNKENIKKKELKDESARHHLQEYAWQRFFMENTQFEAFLADSVNLIFWGNIGDIEFIKEEEKRIQSLTL